MALDKARCYLHFYLYLNDVAKLNDCVDRKFIIVYADDILLTAESVSELRNLLGACEKELITIDMKINVKKSRDVVLEASASARGGLEAVFLAGSASPWPHTVLTRSWLGLEGSALPRLGSIISQLKRASTHGAQVQV